MLAFKAPDGPAMLKLERRNDETTVSLVVRHPQAAKGGRPACAGQGSAAVRQYG